MSKPVLSQETIEKWRNDPAVQNARIGRRRKPIIVPSVPGVKPSANYPEIRRRFFAALEHLREEEIASDARAKGQ